MSTKYWVQIQFRGENINALPHKLVIESTEDETIEEVATNFDELITRPEPNGFERGLGILTDHMGQQHLIRTEEVLSVLITPFVD